MDAGGVKVGVLSVGDEIASGLSLRAARLLPDVAALALIEAAAAEGRVAAHDAVNALTTLSWYAWLLERDGSSGRGPGLLRELAAEARRISVLLDHPLVIDLLRRPEVHGRGVVVVDV